MCHRIICTNDMCLYNKDCRDCTHKGDIVLDDDGQCECYTYYLYTPAYQHEYYTANLHRPTGKYYRQKRNGAVTECNGFTLYYEAKDLTPETMVTEKLTGCSARYEKFQDPEFIKIINDRMPTYPRACELPDLDNLLKERLKGDDK
ncbi:MAG: hypothetical protein IJ172_00030 [Ruminococcus sp.]|nr:hypothetical protein [Ruminococcus sp.]